MQYLSSEGLAHLWSRLKLKLSAVAFSGSFNDLLNKPTYSKSDVGLGNVDNTADADKQVLSASKLTESITINDIEFDGSSNIEIPTGSISWNDEEGGDVFWQE